MSEQPDAVLPAAAQPATQPWSLVDPARATALPIVERTYSSFFQAPRWRWWRALLALLAVLALATVSMTVFALSGIVADGVDLSKLHNVEDLKLGPWGFLGNNVGLAVLIPIAMLGAYIATGQRIGWLSSVVGRFRWRWFGRCLAVVVPIWLVTTAIEYLATGLPPDVRIRPYTVLMIVGILLTTPLQAAGEEYLMRGFEQRLVASFIKPERVGWAVATVVSSLTFMALHAAADVWLNVFYLVFGAVASWVTWKTGGLEAAVAIHVVNNLVSESLMPFTDFSDMFDRSAGAADASVLLPMAVLVAAGVALVWLGRRAGVQTAAAPGRVELEHANHVQAQWLVAHGFWPPQPPAPWPPTQDADA